MHRKNCSGRTESNLLECAAEIKARGGKAITVTMDHGNDAGRNRSALCNYVHNLKDPAEILLILKKIPNCPKMNDFLQLCLHKKQMGFLCSDVESLFERIKSEQNGRLDVLVNNAYAGVSTIFKVGRK